MIVARSPSPAPSMTPPAPRWWQFVRANRIVCPAGHHIPNTVRLPEHGFIRCPHVLNRLDQAAHGDRQRHVVECGLWVYAYVMRGGRAVLVAVDMGELDALEALATPAEVIEYLGIFHR